MKHCRIAAFPLNRQLKAAPMRDLCRKRTNMQYYKGNALQGTAGLPEEKTTSDPSFFQRVGKVLAFPFLLIFWILQDLIHKSFEESD